MLELETKIVIKLFLRANQFFLMVFRYDVFEYVLKLLRLV